MITTLYYEPILKKIYSCEQINPHNTVYLGSTFYCTERTLIQELIIKIRKNEVQLLHKGEDITTEILKELINYEGNI